MIIKKKHKKQSTLDTDMFKTLETNFDEPTTTEPIHVFGPASTERTPSPTAATQETWIDGSEFFKNVLQVRLVLFLPFNWTFF